MTERSPALPELVDDFEAAATRLVATTRRAAAARWGAGSPSLAETVQSLVTLLAELDHAVEIGAGQRPGTWRSPAPAPYPGALPDRLAVVSTDLIAALRAAPPNHQVWYADAPAPVEQLAAAALAAVRATDGPANPATPAS